MTTSDIIMIVSIVMNCIVIVAAPIISVWVAQKLQDRARKRQDKMQMFKTLMTNRIYDWTPQAVYALNSIDIVLSDDENVRQQWKKYYDKLCVENATETELKKMNIEKDKHLETMANSLGYKDKISWETIQNPYIPKGMVISMNQQQQFQAGQLQVLQMLTSIPNNANKNEENQGKQTENRNRKTDVYADPKRAGYTVLSKRLFLVGIWRVGSVAVTLFRLSINNLPPVLFLLYHS